MVFGFAPTELGCRTVCISTIRYWQITRVLPRFYQTGRYQRNQLSENGLAKKEATFIHVIDFLQNQITLKRDDLKRKSRF